MIPFLLASAFTFLVGCLFAYGGYALIRDLHGLRDRFRRGEDDPGGWRRSTYEDPSRAPQGGGFTLSFDYVPKTPLQFKVVGWVFMLGGIFWAVVGVVLIVATLLGEVDYA